MSARDMPRRAAWIAGIRKVLDLLEADPDLLMPGTWGSAPLTWYAYGSRRQIAAVEKALGIPLTGAIDPEDEHYYLLDGDLDGMPVRIRAWASEVVERRVTGTRTVEDVEWVRLPAGDEPAQDQTETEGDS
jgi:hypothetical protein